MSEGVLDKDSLFVLRELDGRFGGRLRSLSPGRRWASTWSETGERICAPLEAAQAKAWALGFGGIVEAIACNFPENIFWDLEFLASHLAALAGNDVGEFEQTVRLVIGLQEKYGCHSLLRFRYAHDFLYGYDWARWVRKDVKPRAAVGPFANSFLSYLDDRGSELAARIGQGDEQYPALPGKMARNPFSFVRDPEAETRLHESLAKDGLIPLAAWNAQSRPRFDQPFSDLRRHRAESLGLPHNREQPSHDPS